MSTHESTDGAASPPDVTLLQLMTGYWGAQAVYIAAKLGLADLLTDGPVSSDDLAAATQTDPLSLYRVLRALASIGVFMEVAPRQFALTPTAALLQTATPGSMRSLAIIYNEELYRAWGDMLHSIQTGQPAFRHHFGMAPFEYFAQHPEVDRVFNEAMIGYTHRVARAVVEAVDFAPFKTIVDVGGGYGTLLAAILQRTPVARGVLFDLPHVIAGAEDYLASAGVADRCTRVGGDFFAAVPSGGDAYVLSQILHDWDPDHCITILMNCRQAISTHGRLLVVELVVPEGNTPDFGKWVDLHMLAITGGRERTAAEYGALFQKTGFELVRVMPTSAGPGVVEARPI
ncbi:MAG TPA: methyltransferase [Roseiflexaceae bacterium]|nr:methyltransferase [Roseiflexaceae bacterium]